MGSDSSLYFNKSDASFPSVTKHTDQEKKYVGHQNDAYIFSVNKINKNIIFCDAAWTVNLAPHRSWSLGASRGFIYMLVLVAWGFIYC